MMKNISSYFSSSASRNDNNADDQTSDRFRTMYGDMPLNEKRKLYRCGDSYVLLDDIPFWPVLYKINAPGIKKAIQRRSSDPGRRKLGEDIDVPKGPLTMRDDLNMKISVWQGDITKLEIDAIVNAANESLLGGGGVDGSIHRSAGPTLVKECRLLNGCRTGEAKLTSGHKLPAKFIIHTVGPRGKHPERLSSCYENCLRIALENDIKSIAFCCISTGVFGYPNRDAAHVALLATRKCLENHAEKFERIIFCTYLSDDFQIYQELMAEKYFPCVPSETEGQREALSRDPQEGSSRSSRENEESRENVSRKCPVEVDESHVIRRNRPSESDDTSLTANDIPTSERNVAIETDDLPSLPNKVEGDSSNCYTVERAAENIDESGDCCQPDIELASQQTEDGAMDLGSQQM